jgi:hypothetical protein
LSAQELHEAVAASASAKNAQADLATADLALAELRTIDDLRQVLGRYQSSAVHPPLWVIYPKGPGKPLGESAIRTALRSEGFIDTKVASVSPTLTALKFIRRA